MIRRILFLNHALLGSTHGMPSRDQKRDFESLTGKLQMKRRFLKQAQWRATLIPLYGLDLHVHSTLRCHGFVAGLSPSVALSQ